MNCAERQAIQSKSCYYLEHPSERPLIGKHSYRDVDGKIEHITEQLNITRHEAREWIKRKI